MLASPGVLMADELDDVLDSLFHGCALAAYVDQAIAEQGRPDSEATRQRAYAYYEDALAEKNRRKSAGHLDPPALCIVRYTERKDGPDDR